MAKRRGGGKQVVTAGGFSTGAVKNINKNGGKKWLVQKKTGVMRLSSH